MKPRLRTPRSVKLAACLTTLGLCGLILSQRYLNACLFTVLPGKVYRSAWPSPNRLIQWGHRYHLRSVINLCPADPSELADQVRTTRIAALELLHVPLPPRRMPTRKQLLQLIHAIESAPLPLLIHGRHGLDRTALAAAIAAMALGDRTYRQARRECSWQRLHPWTDWQDGSAVLLAYEQYCRRHHLPLGSWAKFRHWATQAYFPHYYGCAIDLPPHARAAPGQTLRIQAQLSHLACQSLPAGQPQKHFSLVGFIGPAPPRSDRAIISTTALPDRNIQPEESLFLDIFLSAPLQPGEHILHFDLLENDGTWFSTEGSPLSSMILTVQPH